MTDEKTPVQVAMDEVDKALQSAPQAQAPVDKALQWASQSQGSNHRPPASLRRESREPGSLLAWLHQFDAKADQVALGINERLERIERFLGIR